MDKTVKEIHNERSKMWNASIANHKKYLNQKTGMFEEEFVETRPCPVCKSSNELEIFCKEGGRYVKCQDCNMIYLNPVFNDMSLKDYYENNHIEQSKIVENDVDDFYLNLYSSGLNDIQNSFPNIKNILDIGCSSGSFLDLAREKGLLTYGVELNQAEYELAVNKGHVVYNELFEKIIFNESFDAITMWDVFEHIKDGESCLKSMKKRLSPHGVIFLQIPSSDALAAKILRERCNMYDGLEHVNLYGVETIQMLANECDLEVINLKTVISEIGVINNYLNYEDPYGGSTLNKDYIPSLIDEKRIHESLQGYKLQVVLGHKI